MGPRPAAVPGSVAMRFPNSGRNSLPCFFAGLVYGQFFVQSRDHLADARLGEPFGTRMSLPQASQALFEEPEFFLGLLVLDGVGNHRTTSTRPLRRPSASRVRPKNSTHSSQSV